MKILTKQFANILIILATLFLTACHSLPNKYNNLTHKNLAGNWIISVENRQNQFTKLLMTDTQGNVVNNLAHIQGKIFGLSLSVDKRFLLYTVQHKNFPQIYLLDLITNQTKHILAQKANYFGASLSPDNQHLLFSATFDNNPEIFLQNLNNNFVKKITNNHAIDISPVWFSDNQRFLFSSDNNPQNQPKLYQYQLDKQTITPVAEQNYQTNARISANDRYITFFSKTDKGWQNLLMDLQTQALITVRDDELADYVNFSPKGDFLLYPYYHDIVVLPTPTLQNGTFLPDFQKKYIKIKQLSNDEQIKEVVWVR